jgi:hypothetical protein
VRLSNDNLDPSHFLFQAELFRYLDPAGGVRATGFYCLGFGYSRLASIEQIVPGPIRLGNLVTSDVVLPHWLLVLAFAVLPVSWCRSELRRRRLAKVGLRPKCGYDLCATPERCPECGAPATPAKAQPAEGAAA